MKSQKGITLASLTVYIIGITIMIATISVISSYFYTNMSDTSNTIDPLTEYTKFNTFFTEEVNHQNIKILECKTKFINDNEADGVEKSYIVFDNGVQYTFIGENQGIYRNQVKIGKNIKSCIFNYEIEKGKNKVTVEVEAQKNNFKRTQTYTLGN